MGNLILNYAIRPCVKCCFCVCNCRSNKSNNILPKCKSELLLMPVHKLAKKIRNKEIKCVELIQVYIDRIKEVNPHINCAVVLCFDEALEKAKDVDEFISSAEFNPETSEKETPLLGVPFSCKESIFVKGKPSTAGMVNRKNLVADDDSDVVKNIKKSGGILLCLTNTAEGCRWIESNNKVYGKSRNPYNLSRIVGGSTGGEGGLIAAAGSVFGVAADIGGSIRIPSFFNGVFGHKPSSNFISNVGQYPPAVGIQEPLLGTGPICRYASDLNLLLKVFAGSSYPEMTQKLDLPVDLNKINFYVITDLHGYNGSTKISRDCRDGLVNVISFIEKNLNKKVIELRPPQLKHIFDIWSSFMRNGNQTSYDISEMVTFNNTEFKPFKELFKSIFCGNSQFSLPIILLAINELNSKIENPKSLIDLGVSFREELAKTLGDDGVLLAHTFPVPAPYHHMAAVTNTKDFIFSGLFNVLGFPITQTPLGLNRDGLPVGIQISAGPSNDHLTVRVAQYIEENVGGWVPPS